MIEKDLINSKVLANCVRKEKCGKMGCPARLKRKGTWLNCRTHFETHIKLFKFEFKWPFR